MLVDAELDWREWTDQPGAKREAVTLRARQVIFEGGRRATVGSDEDGEANGGSPPVEAGERETVGAAAVGAGGVVSADNLPVLTHTSRHGPQQGWRGQPERPAGHAWRSCPGGRGP